MFWMCLNNNNNYTLLRWNLQDIILFNRKTSSPAAQTSLMMDCLVNIKTVIAVLQKSSELVKRYLYGDCCHRYQERGVADEELPQLASTKADNTEITCSSVKAVMSRLIKNMSDVLVDSKCCIFLS